MSRRGLGVAFALAALALPACGTIFPRYRTSMRPPPPGMLEGGGYQRPPPNLRRLEFVSAELPPSRPDGQQWDEDGPPDLYAVLYRNREEIYRTPVARDTLRPEWADAAINVRLDPHARIRVELRDDDGAVSTLVSDIEFTGIPEGAGGGDPEGAAGGSNVVLRLDNGVTLRLRSAVPPPMVGMGVEYEVHETFLRVLSVVEVSPAAAAGLRFDDRILSVDGRSVSDLGEVGARQAMDRASLRNVTLNVQREGRPPFVVDVRLDAVYPAR